MTLKRAWERVALAGRELGSDPYETLTRFPYEAELRELGILDDHARGIAMGVLVGQAMAESEQAMAGLRQINADWLAGKTRQARDGLPQCLRGARRALLRPTGRRSRRPRGRARLYVRPRPTGATAGGSRPFLCRGGTQADLPSGHGAGAEGAAQLGRGSENVRAGGPSAKCRG